MDLVNVGAEFLEQNDLVVVAVNLGERVPPVAVCLVGLDVDRKSQLVNWNSRFCRLVGHPLEYGLQVGKGRLVELVLRDFRKLLNLDLPVVIVVVGKHFLEEGRDLCLVKHLVKGRLNLDLGKTPIFVLV